MVSFKVSKSERAIIEHIADRAWGLEWLRENYDDRVSLVMDVTATHANGNRLRLNDLLGTDDFNFAHDLGGICSCLDRDTGKLTGNFRPRFSEQYGRANANLSTDAKFAAIRAALG